MTIQILLFATLALAMATVIGMVLKGQLKKAAMNLGVCGKFSQISNKKKSKPTEHKPADDVSAYNMTMKTSNHTSECLAESAPDNACERRRLVAQMVEAIINNIGTSETPTKKQTLSGQKKAYFGMYYLWNVVVLTSFLAVGILLYFFFIWKTNKDKQRRMVAVNGIRNFPTGNKYQQTQPNEARSVELEINYDFSTD